MLELPLQSLRELTENRVKSPKVPCQCDNCRLASNYEKIPNYRLAVQKKVWIELSSHLSPTWRLQN